MSDCGPSTGLNYIPSTTVACVWIKDGCCSVKRAWRQMSRTAQGIVSTQYFDSADCTTPIPAPVVEAPAPESISDVVAAVQAAVASNSPAPDTIPLLTDILTELQKPQYDIETATCNDGTDDWLMVLDKNVLVAGVPAITYQNLTTGATASVRPPGLTCATPPIPTCPTLPGRGVQTSW